MSEGDRVGLDAGDTRVAVDRWHLEDAHVEEDPALGGRPPRGSELDGTTGRRDRPFTGRRIHDGDIKAPALAGGERLPGGRGPDREHLGLGPPGTVQVEVRTRRDQGDRVDRDGSGGVVARRVDDVQPARSDLPGHDIGGHEWFDHQRRRCHRRRCLGHDESRGGKGNGQSDDPDAAWPPLLRPGSTGEGRVRPPTTDRCSTPPLFDDIHRTPPTRLWFPLAIIGQHAALPEG